MALLSALNLRGGYNSLEVLHGVDFEVDEGQLVVVLGPNGAGKSTLLGCLVRTVRTFSGTITFNGRSILSSRTSEVARTGLVLVPQEGNVFTDLSVQENLALAVSATSRGLERSKQVGRLSDAVYDRFPFLSLRQNQPAALLSGGERQALAVSMGFLQNPTLMLLDEPTAGLSQLAAANLESWILERVTEGLSIVWVVEQDPETVLKSATSAYLLDGGYVKYSGPAQALAGKGANFLFQLQDKPTIIGRTEK